MRNLLKVELYKLAHGKELAICIFVLLIYSAINIAFGGYDSAKAILTTESSEIIGLIYYIHCICS